MTKSSASMKIACERDGTRRLVPRTDTAWIDVPAPDGKTWSVPLLDLSRKGLSFGIDGTELDGRIDRGDALPDVTIHIDDREFGGAVHMEESNASFTGTAFLENAAKFGAAVETFISEFHVRACLGLCCSCVCACVCAWR